MSVKLGIAGGVKPSLEVDIISLTGKYGNLKLTPEIFTGGTKSVVVIILSTGNCDTVGTKSEVLIILSTIEGDLPIYGIPTNLRSVVATFQSM